MLKSLAGIYVAAITPLNQDYSIDVDAIPQLLKFFRKRGCHGALMAGTTGEGPSLNTAEREVSWSAATQIKEEHPDFKLLAGTGTPSLDQTIELNKIAFELGFDGVVTLPPFYFRNASEQGIFEWFSKVIDASVPEGRWLFAYHFPQVSGIGFSPNLLKRLRDAYPDKFGGLKDSSGDIDFTRQISRELDDRLVLVGNDRLLQENLSLTGSGCITAMANLISPLLRNLWDHQLKSIPVEQTQEKIVKARQIGESVQPFPSSIKALLALLHGFPEWAVKPPLMPYPDVLIQQAARDISALLQ